MNEQNIAGLPPGMRVKQIIRCPDWQNGGNQLGGPCWYHAELEPIPPAESAKEPLPGPTMEELVKIWTDIALSEDAQRCANGNKDWNAERAIGIRAVAKRLEASGGRISE